MKTMPPQKPPAPPVIQPDQPPTTDPLPSQPMPSMAGPEQSYKAAPHHDYSFIMNPEHPPKSAHLPSLGGGSSMAVRIGLTAGGLLLLLVAFVIIKGLLAGGSNQPLFVAILQDQQELIHLTSSSGTGQGGLGSSLGVTGQGSSAAISNFAATAQLSLTSAQTDLTTYMSKAGMKKINPKQLNLKVSSTIDERLKTAAAADTYAQTFQEVMKTQLTQYQQDLSLAYDKTKGPNGRKVLSGEYKQSQLLQTQLAASN